MNEKKNQLKINNIQHIKQALKNEQWWSPFKRGLAFKEKTNNNLNTP